MSLVDRPELFQVSLKSFGVLFQYSLLFEEGSYLTTYEYTCIYTLWSEVNTAAPSTLLSASNSLAGEEHNSATHFSLLFTHVLQLGTLYYCKLDSLTSPDNSVVSIICSRVCTVLLFCVFQREGKMDENQNIEVKNRKCFGKALFACTAAKLM